MAEENVTDAAWRKILENHPDIIKTVHAGGVYKMPAAEIKKYREPRLMTKHDTSEMVPAPLKSEKLNILPISRSTYAISDFILFEQFPDVSEIHPKLRTLPDFETLTADNITSESNAINALIASEILDDFLGTENTVETFNGRMGSGNFSFHVNRKNGSPALIDVRGAQLEIDGGFENDDSVIIMEAKNVRHSDFHIRQLYYPYRKYRELIDKPIRLIFSQYTNMTYYLYEYAFNVPEDYNSLRHLRTEAYTFEDSRITASELRDALTSTRKLTDDNQNHTRVPFIQADRFDRVISLMERLANEPEGLTTEEVANFLGTVERQASYYPAAGEYLGLFDRRERGRTKLTKKAQDILKLNLRERRIALAKSMFEHEILRRCFFKAFTTGKISTVEEVIPWMAELNVCNPGENDSMYKRRAQSVIAWTRWLMSLVDDE